MANGEIIKTVVDDFITFLEERASEAANRGERLRSPLSAVEIPDYFKLVGKVLGLQQKNEGAKNLLAYMEDFPEEDDNINGEVITYSILERKPGTFEQTGISSALSERNIRQRRKMFREVTADPEYPGSRLYSYGQWFDNVVAFRVWARTNKVANKRALWLEKTLEQWEWYLTASGVSKAIYLGRDEDQVFTPNNFKVSCRTLRYFVRTERITTVREQILRSLIIKGTNL